MIVEMSRKKGGTLLTVTESNNGCFKATRKNESVAVSSLPQAKVATIGPSGEDRPDTRQKELNNAEEAVKYAQNGLELAKTSEIGLRGKLTREELVNAAQKRLNAAQKRLNNAKQAWNGASTKPVITTTSTGAPTPNPPPAPAPSVNATAAKPTPTEKEAKELINVAKERGYTGDAALSFLGETIKLFGSIGQTLAISSLLARGGSYQNRNVSQRKKRTSHITYKRFRR